MPDSARAPLPVDEVLPDVARALDTVGRVVLEAPPGAGKTTRVPLALLDAPWRCGGRLVVLEPRRLAARAAARHMAALLGEPVGATVGYVTRDERRVSARTAVEVVTEGVLLRRIQRDPALDGVAALLFDEFHERSLVADLGLAFALDVRGALRDDLRLVAMSATLDGARVAGLLDAPVVASQGRTFEVDTRYRPRPVTERVEDAVARVVAEALGATAGDLLAFLPGAREIRRAERLLADRVGGEVLLAPLYGALAPDAQDRALAPAPPGTRKVVLATDIAETSLTIEGVRVVVDGGLTREPRFDPRTGMSGLETVRASRSSADQRRGRAGRTAAGVCYRLWSRREDAGLPPHRVPEIAQADLAGFALEVAAWGADVGELRLLDPPPARTYGHARELLHALGALDGDGRITGHGRTLVDLPLHPRLAHLLVAATERGAGGLACELAALLADRDVLTTDPGVSHVDAATRVRVLRGEPPPAGTRVRRGAVARARREAARLRRRLGVDPGGDPERAGELLALAYPDRLAQRRGGRGRFLLANGRGAVLPTGDVLAGAELLAVAGVDLGAREARIFTAAPLDGSRLAAVAGDAIREEEVAAWDDDLGDVAAERRERLGALILARRPLDPPPDAATTAALLTGIRSCGLTLLPWDRRTRQLRARAAFLHRALGDAWPELSDACLLDELEAWLAPFLTGLHRVADLDRVPLEQALWQRIGWERRSALDELAPTHLEVPSGARIRLDYDHEVPVLAVRVQQVFGWRETPRVAGGAVPVMVHLLSPAHRPVQITQDLAGFWERGYAEVRAELRGRYPKHPWPEDPMGTPPTDRATRRP